VRAALQLVAAFDHSPMAGFVDLRRIDVSSPGVVVTTTEQGSKITFSLDNLDQQLQRWREIYDLGQRMNKVIVTLDLAVSNNVPVRWTEASMLPVAAPKSVNPAHVRRNNV
jgi:cell division septal protein FtsQ